jgi:hypothetical protein
MYAKIICNPPLGQTTVVSGGAKPVLFTVILETDPASEKAWEVALWSNVHTLEHHWDGWHGKDWTTHFFEESKRTSSLVRNLVPHIIQYLTPLDGRRRKART